MKCFTNAVGFTSKRLGISKQEVMEETKRLKDKCSLYTYIYISYNKYSINVQIADYWNAVENGLSYNMALARSSKFNINISEAQR